MESYDYVYQPRFSPMCPPEAIYPDRGDGYEEYYGMAPLNDDRVHKRRSRSHQRKAKKRDSKRTLSRSKSRTPRASDRSQSRSRSRSRSRGRSRSRSRSRNRSHSRSSSRHRELNLREPSFLDAFRVLYLKPSKHKKNTTKYLATKKRQDRIQEILKSDGLGSKRWLFYPRSRQSETAEDLNTKGCDRRVKIDGDFFRKYKMSRKVDSTAPIAKLKRWELIFYKKLGFIQAV